MLDGSVTISSSMPRAAIAARVLAIRAAYSARSKYSLGSVMSELALLAAVAVTGAQSSAGSPC